MPSPRKYATRADRQAAYRQRCAMKRASTVSPIARPLAGSRRWNALTDQARAILAEVAREMTTYWQERSDAWQSSERGELLNEQVETLEEILDLLRELTGTMPR